ncbi:TauD/TfdA family dioxygenase [Massilia sp. CF038]|uniref:TauD/TfdA family dioxygenase n=1 Tax=Massilia sp. CF038 TaxID=1881045 RepID=UPI0009172228|nr:TauD/TfdA family dioxygenase [Massilia sp. CF038]SHG61185.1 Taurine dioxygenase, alpha-ketoglutarate-dependent [Massilia sp. CF038]
MSADSVAAPRATPFAGRRQAIAVGSGELVRVSALQEGSRIALCTPTIPGMDARDWLRRADGLLGRLLKERGAVLLRGFGALDAAGLGELATLHAGALREYDNRSTPRTQVSGRVFTSTEYPADQTIPMHNEMSYTDAWPALLFLACVQPSVTGGETPLADSARVYARIAPDVRERFERDGVMYVRNFGLGLDLSWQEVFQTSDRSQVDAYCKAHGIAAEWLGGERLRTRHVVQASLLCQATGERVWFNQGHLFHVSSLPHEVEQELRADFAEDELPRNAMHGDGTPFTAHELADIRAAYKAEEIATPWQAGDVVVVDNEQFAHGRRPYTGPRSILVAMT